MCFSLLQRVSRVAPAALFVLVVFVGKVLACSGEHAAEHSAENHSMVNWWGALAILIFLAIVALCLLLYRVGIPAILLAAVIGFFHPMWFYGGGGGDCGEGFVVLAKYVTIALGGILLLQLALCGVRRLRFATART
jgi:hypothetical protein